MIVLLSLSLLPLVASQMCEHGTKTYNTHEHYIEDCQQCTCYSGNWDCSYYNTGNCGQQQTTEAPSQSSHYMCEKNQKKYDNGEKVVGECETCTCYSGQWECSYYNTGNCQEKPSTKDSVTCKHGQKTYENEEQYVENCEQCTCSRGEWSCKKYESEECKESNGAASQVGKTGKNADDAKKNDATKDDANAKKEDGSSVKEPDAKKHNGAANDANDEESDSGKTVKPVYYVIGAVGLVAAFGGIAFAVTVFKGSAAAAASQGGAVAFENAAQPMVEQDLEAGKATTPMQRQFV